jgi:hypothetical protein
MPSAPFPLEASFLVPRLGLALALGFVVPAAVRAALDEPAVHERGVRVAATRWARWFALPAGLWGASSVPLPAGWAALALFAPFAAFGALCALLSVAGHPSANASAGAEVGSRAALASTALAAGWGAAQAAGLALLGKGGDDALRLTAQIATEMVGPLGIAAALARWLPRDESPRAKATRAAHGVATFGLTASVGWLAGALRLAPARATWALGLAAVSTGLVAVLLAELGSRLRTSLGAKVALGSAAVTGLAWVVVPFAWRESLLASGKLLALHATGGLLVFLLGGFAVLRRLRRASPS